jgi:hypothetical protein
MIAIPVDEHMSILLATYQFAEKVCSQMVSDLVAAEVRLDEAERFKNDAFERLQNARERSVPFGAEVISGAINETASQGKLTKTNTHEVTRTNPTVRFKMPTRKQHATSETNSDVGARDHLAHSPSTGKLMSSAVAPRQSPAIALVDNKFLSPSMPVQQTISEGLLAKQEGIATPPSSPSRAKRALGGRPVSCSPLPLADQEALSPRKSIRSVIAETSAQKCLPVAQCLQPIESIDEKQVAAPPIRIVVAETIAPTEELHSDLLPRRKPRPVVVALKAYAYPKPTLRITKGRSREWLEKNLDYEAFGLVKKFYLATIGTKTNEKAHKVTVRTIVLSDEWNNLATDTHMVQEMYVVKSTGENSGGGGTSQRDRAALALVDSVPSHPIALFFAPKKTLDTNDLYYVGHWKVVDGKILDPPEMIDGHLRQAVAKFAFAGVDKNIVDALNRDT